MHLQPHPTRVRHWLALLVSLFLTAHLASALPTISEFSATGGLEDEEGIDNDWIEIYNPDSVPVSLAGHYLTDDAENLTKWMFPEVTLDPDSYLVVFASNVNRIDPAGTLHTNFRLSSAGEFLALVAPDGETPLKQFAPGFPEQRATISYGTGSIGSSTRETIIPVGADAKWHVPSEEVEGWTDAIFDDAAWQSGKTGIGFGYDELTGEGGNAQELMKGNNASLYVRIPFELPQPQAVIAMSMKLKYEDGFVAYLNGNPVADDRAPAADEIAFDSKATESRSDSLAEEYENFEIRFDGKLVQGTNVLAFQVMNTSAGGSDLLLLPELTVEFRDLDAPIGDGFFIEPTPGKTNSVGSGNPPAPVGFSITSQTFTDPVTVELSTSDPDAVIRYTTDGSIPVDTVADPSPEYTGPLVFDDTVQLRTRAFSPGKLAGPVRSEAFIKLSEDFADFTSQLPIIIMDNFGKGNPSRDRMFFTLIFEPKGPENRASVRNMPDLVTRSRARQRGSSTGGWPKWGLNFEAWDEFDNDKPIAPLGMPADSDWVFNTRYEFDRALMRNPFMYRLSNQIGQYAPRNKFVEMFINTDGEDVDNESRRRSDYIGVYCVMEKISRGKDRVNVSRLDRTDSEEPEVTGGYMFKVDRLDPGDRGIRGIRDASNSVGWIYPKERVNRVQVVTDEQQDYLVGFFNEFVAAAKADDFINPDTGKHYSEYIDVTSWLNEHILRGLSKDPDAFRLSTYLHKPRGGKIHYGPLWDFDRTMGCDTDGRAVNPERWDGGTAWWTYAWWRELVWEPGRRRANRGDPDFMQAYVDQYQKLRLNQMSVENMDAIIDGMAAEIGKDAADRNFARWPEKRPNGGRFDGGLDGWEGEVAHLKGWLKARVEWWDTLFADRPKLSIPEGVVADQTQLAMIADAGPVYYTLDGSDPRAPGGGVAEGAIQFPGGRVDTTILEENATARYLVPTDGSLGNAWNGLAFDAAAWTEATTGLGFETNGGTLEEKISTNISDVMKGVNASVFVRIDFMIENEVTNVNSMTLKMQYDDGFVAYINGTEVARANAPDTLEWNSEATSSHTDSKAIVFEEFEVENPKDFLVKGRNVLAIQAMNTSVGGSDMLIQAGMDINQTLVAQPLVLDKSVVVTARTQTDELWSSPVVQTYIVGGTVPASADNLVVSEFMHSPPFANVEEDATGFSAGAFEFLEVTNISSSVVDLTDVRFTDGISFEFVGSAITFLLPGQRAVVVRNAEAFEMRYGPAAMARVAGEFAEDTALRGTGERITMTALGGTIIKDFLYEVVDPWPVASSPEDRFSLVLVDPSSNPNHENGANWMKSTEPLGTPGTGAAIDPSDPSEDKDGDGLSAFLEFALGSTDDDPNSGRSLIGVGSGGVGPTFSYQKNLSAADVVFALETSTDLITWINADDQFELVSETDNGDGTARVSVKWKGDAPPAGGDVYIRLKATGSQ